MSTGLPFQSRRRRRVLSRASAAWVARNYNATLDALVDVTGNGLHARLGSSVGADSNDPLRLRWSGRKEVYFTGSNNDSISMPDRAEFAVAGVLTIELFSSDYVWNKADGNERYFVAQYAAGQAAIVFGHTGAGLLVLYTSANGSTQRTAFSTVAMPYAAGGAAKVTRDPATGDVTFFHSEDGVTWTQLGDVVSTTAEGIHDSTQTMYIGGLGNVPGGMIFGRLAWLRVYDGSTKIIDFDAALLVEPYSSATDSCGNVLTLNRGTSGRKLTVVDRDLLLLGSDDYLEVPDSPLLNFGAGQTGTLVWFGRYYGATVGFMSLMQKKVDGFASDVGYRFNTANTDEANLLISDGTNQDNPSYAGLLPGVASMVSATFTPSRNSVYRGGTILGSGARTAGSLSVSRVLQLGRQGSSYANVEFIGAAIFREDLSPAQRRQLAAEIGVAQ